MRIRFFTIIVFLNILNLCYAQSEQDFKLKFYATNWGMAESWDSYCAKVKRAGYDGLETWLPGSEEEQKEMNDALRNNGLSLGLLSGGGGGSFEQYFESFVNNVKAAVSMEPDYVNCHTGKDYYTFEQNSKLINATEQISKESGVPIYHETHRGRFSFAAHVTAEYLKAIPHLTLALDISHWCNVHESMLGDQKETVDLALSRSGHIHARVGHPQGPQVNDPSAPEWKSVVEQHLAWWGEIINFHKQRGVNQVTITPEFGPPGYMPTLPYTQQPVSSQWKINEYMMNLIKSRYQ